MISLYLDNSRKLLWDISIDEYVKIFADPNYDHLFFNREPNHDEIQRVMVIIKKDIVDMVEEIIE